MEHKRMSYKKAAQIFRAINGEWVDYPEVTMADVENLDVSGETFSEFIEKNKSTIQFYDEVDGQEAVSIWIDELPGVTREMFDSLGGSHA